MQTTSGTRSDRRQTISPPRGGDHALMAAARFAIVLAVIYAIPHIWWGLGIDWLAPADLGSNRGLGANAVTRFIAFYGMGALALFSAVLVRDMIRPAAARFPTWFLALHGWGIGVLLVMRGGIGLVETSLVLTGVRDCPFVGCGTGQAGRESIGMTGAFWEPVFMAWGVALLTTVVLWSRSRRRG